MTTNHLTLSQAFIHSRDIDDTTRFLLDVYFYEYNQAKFRYTNVLRDGKNNGLTRKSIKALSDQKGYLPYRVFKGIETNVKALVESQHTKRKNQCVEIEDKIHHVEKQVKKWKDKYKNLKKNQFLKNQQSDINENAFKKEASNLRFLIDKKSMKLQRLQQKRNQLQQEVINKKISLCFGSKSLFKQRHNIHPNNHQDKAHWQQMWHNKRYKDMYFIGSSDEMMGNSNAHIIQKEGQFYLKIIFPETLMKHPKVVKYFHHKPLKKKRWVIELPIAIKTHQNALEQHIALHHHLDDKKDVKIPLSVRLMRRNDKSMDVHMTLQGYKGNIVTTQKQGTIGVDINPDNLAVSEVDRRGNLIQAFTLPLPLENKTSGQRHNIISLAIDDVIHYAQNKGKSIVLEHLDFKKKRNALYKNYDSNYARMLSAFAYSKIKELFIAKAFRKQIKVLFVNPAYTSQIGMMKYQFKYQIESHESAAMVIARRGMGFKERLPSRLGRLVINSNPEKKPVSMEFLSPVDDKKLQNRQGLKTLFKINKPLSQTPGDCGIELPTKRLSNLVHKLLNKDKSVSFTQKYVYFPLDFSNIYWTV